MDLKVKLLIGLGGAGTAGGIGIITYPYLSKEEKESILTVITNQGKKFILSTADDTHNAQWASIKESVKDDAVTKQEIGDPIDETKLKKWCSDTSKKESYEDGLLKKFEDRCTRNTILTETKEKLEQGKSLIAFEDGEGWNNSYSNYKTQATSEDLQIIIDGTKITKEAMASKTANDIRDWCKSMNNALFENETSHSYKAFNKWCVKG